LPHRAPQPLRQKPPDQQKSQYSQAFRAVFGFRKIAARSLPNSSAKITTKLDDLHTGRVSNLIGEGGVEKGKQAPPGFETRRSINGKNSVFSIRSI
jgi:hypothetical protein